MRGVYRGACAALCLALVVGGAEMTALALAPEDGAGKKRLHGCCAAGLLATALLAGHGAVCGGAREALCVAAWLALCWAALAYVSHHSFQASC